MRNNASYLQKTVLGFLAVCFCLLLFTFYAGAQPDEIELNNNKIFVNKKKPSVMFPHSEHMDQFDCLDCHHRFQNSENVLDTDTLEEESPGIRCQDCHFREGFRFTPELDPTKRSLMQAFHKQCISCHRAEKGPRTCNECHTK